MKNEVHAIPPVVGKLNHFDFDAQTLSETHFRQIPWTAPDVQRLAGLTEYTKTVIRYIARYFATGAERGIEQTAKLLCDPNYYATLKERRRRDRDRQRVYDERQKQDQLEQKLAPTAEQIERELDNLDKWIHGNEADLQRMKERRAELQTMVPKHARIDTLKKREFEVTGFGQTTHITLPGPRPFGRKLEPLDPPVTPSEER